MDTALKSIALLALFTIYITAQGYVLSVTWGWFIVPIFGVPTLGMGYAMGLFLVLDQFRKTKSKDSNPFDGEFIEILMITMEKIFNLVFILSLAWIVKSFLI